MAYIVERKVKGYSYWYVVTSRRQGAQTRQKVLEYLGRNPSKKRLAEARKYWKVKSKRRKKR